MSGTWPPSQGYLYLADSWKVGAGINRSGFALLMFTFLSAEGPRGVALIGLCLTVAKNKLIFPQLFLQPQSLTQLQAARVCDFASLGILWEKWERVMCAEGVLPQYPRAGTHTHTYTHTHTHLLGGLIAQGCSSC
jgi:hypothetical protein